jgi:integrase
MKLPNGYGSVYKLSGKRRKPWAVRITKNLTYDKETGKAKQERIIIGYYETKSLALQALARYNENPYDLHVDSITFSELYEKWSEEYFKTLSSPSSIRTITAAYNHCEPLFNLRMKEIKTIHLEEAIKNAVVGDSTKARMKSLFNLMYKYALKHDIVDKDYASLCEPVIRREPAREAIPFTDKEIQTLWNNLDIPFVDMVLIGIYSGWRPQELAVLKTADIDLENETMFGGLKTEAGKNRYVPIHKKIMPLIEANYNKENEYLFNDKNGQQGTSMTYDKYRGRFNKIMIRLKMKHRPHETRHTFITKAKSAGMDEYILKLIVGHAIRDVTEKVYTHRTMQQLKEEINKIN